MDFYELWLQSSNANIHNSSAGPASIYASLKELRGCEEARDGPGPRFSEHLFRRFVRFRGFLAFRNSPLFSKTRASKHFEFESETSSGDDPKTFLILYA